MPFSIEKADERLAGVQNVETEEFILNMGPQHPSTHGVLRVLLRMDGEVVKKAQVYFGYLHRCYEKMAENLTYTQNIPYTDRWDYLMSIHNNYALCGAIEKLMDLEIPKRAEYLRVLALELQRIHSHLMWVSAFCLDLGATTVLMYCMRERELLNDIFEELCGARLTYHYIRIGGVMHDLSERAIDKIEKLVREFPYRLKEYEDLIAGNEIFLMRLRGIGIIKPEDAINYSLAGPMLRGSGINWDLRKNQPYSVYPEIDFDVCMSERCDNLGRFHVRVDEMYQSARIVEQCLNWLKENPEPGGHRGDIPKVIKPPAGEVYFGTESAKGEIGIYLISDGSDKPYRIHVREPSFVNLTVLDYLARGYLIADLVASLGSIDIVLGGVDR
jgi:NADH-quinone oxidoreductase subunit D